LFEWFKSKPTHEPIEIRNTLFGDLPLSRWTCVSGDARVLEPWASFVRAEQFISSGDARSATAVLQSVLGMPHLESRHYLQAYSFLRELGVNAPPEHGKTVLGVVVEVGMVKGLDIVAGYADHHARYYNYSGAGVVWERPNSTLDAPIDDLLRVGGAVAQAIGPWNDKRPPAPPKGQARINLLVPSGLHFGQGPLDSLAKDRLGGPVIASAFRLMQALIGLSKK
jgi:hypothetical protein